MIGGMRDADELAIEPVDGIDQHPVTLAVRRSARDLVEGERHDPRRQGSNASGRWGRPVRLNSGIRGTMSWSA